MRITRLLLARYGHLNDIDLRFDPAVGCHVVLGANEAGKSTALAAVADALFGFPHRTPFAFLHQRQLSVGLGLQRGNRHHLYFVRQKGRPDRLTDGNDSTLTEPAIAPFLAGAGRERFTELYGMDSDKLRRGGDQILRGEGEVGQSIAQALTGLRGVREAAAKLGVDAQALYGDRRGSKAFHVAVQAWKAARDDLDKRSVPPADYERTVADLDRSKKRRADNATALAALDGERARLERVRRTAPLRQALERDRAARAELGVVPSLPADAITRRAEAVLAREHARQQHARAVAAGERDEAALAAITVDVAVLDAGAEIEAAAADRNRVDELRRNAERDRLRAEEARRHLEQAGRQLGLALDAAALVARIPNKLVRAAAERALNAHAKLYAKRDETALAVQKASDTLATSCAASADIAEPASADALMAAIEAARGEGRVDAELADARAARDVARASVARAMAALPLWSRDAEALDALKLPLAESQADAEANLAGADAELDQAQRALTGYEAELRAIAADLTGARAAGPMPTTEAVEAARQRRDHAWRLIRRQHIEGGAPPDAWELEDLPADLVEDFPALIGDADHLADRRASESERVAQYGQMLSREARLQALCEAARQDCAAARDRRERAWTAWAALWGPAGLEPGTPAVMREWLRRRDGVLSALAEHRAREAAVQRTEARFREVWDLLASVVPEVVPAAGQSAATLLRAAEQRLDAWENAGRKFADARQALGVAERRVEEETRRHADAVQELEHWQGEWDRVAASLGLPSGAAAEAGADALPIWAEVEQHARELAAASERTRGASAEVERFDVEVAAIGRRCGEADAPAGELARRLAARLTVARAAAADRVRLAAALEDHARDLGKLSEDISAAEDVLSGLRALAGAEDDAQLAAVIKKSSEAARLDQLIRKAEADLRDQDDGLSLDALTGEADGIAPETIRPRLDDIDSRRSGLVAENEKLAVDVRELESALQRMQQGMDAAAAAQRMHEAAAEAQAVAQRYVRVRLAATLLSASIEQQRRERQEPMLAEAGELFAQLTEGRYDRLGTDETDDGKPVIVAQRPDRTHCPVDRLSEGTRDQLFLALRLAAIRMHARVAEPLPFLADDLLASFDDQRARAAMRVFEAFGEVTQVILFTHHAYVAALADPGKAQVLRLAASSGPLLSAVA